MTARHKQLTTMPPVTRGAMQNTSPTAPWSSSKYGEFGDSTGGLNEQLAGQVFSPETVAVMKRIQDLETAGSSRSESTYERRTTLDERLFDARASVKVLLSQVSMHFSKALREKLFHQIDLLHDQDDWEDSDEPIRLPSFKTFLRWFFLIEPQLLPSFGLSDSGYFIASWLSNDNKDSLILEFLPNDQIRWFVTKHYGEEVDRCTGSTRLTRISTILSPYHADDWFGEERQ